MYFSLCLALFFCIVGSIIWIYFIQFFMVGPEILTHVRRRRCCFFFCGSEYEYECESECGSIWMFEYKFSLPFWHTWMTSKWTLRGVIYFYFISNIYLHFFFPFLVYNTYVWIYFFMLVWIKKITLGERSLWSSWSFLDKRTQKC